MSDDLTAQQAAALTDAAIAANAQATAERIRPLVQDCLAQVRTATAAELYALEIPLHRSTTSADRLALTRALQQRGFSVDIRTEERQSVDVHVLLIGWQPSRTPRPPSWAGGTHLLEHPTSVADQPHARLHLTPAAPAAPPSPPSDDAPGSGPP